MRTIEVQTCGDFCNKCPLFEMEDITLNAWFAPDMHMIRCKHYINCSKAIELFSESKGIKNEKDQNDDDWFEDQAL